MISAVFTAVCLIVPSLSESSFGNIGVTPEFWLLAAIFIVVNCKTMKEAALRCFVFFLISQPLIYLFQVPFSSLRWGLFGYDKYWFIATLLTVPAALVCFQIKKKNTLGAFIPAVASGCCGFAAADFLRTAVLDFPRNLLSGLFCFGATLLLAFALFTEKKHRLIQFAVFANLFTP